MDKDLNTETSDCPKIVMSEIPVLDKKVTSWIENSFRILLVEARFRHSSYGALT